MGTNSPSNSPAKQREYRERFASKPKDVVTEKSCRKCDKVKPSRDFNKMSASSDGLQSYCRDCGAEVRRSCDLARYGLTPETFQAMIEAQDGLCAICSKVPEQSGTVLWAIDHDHDCCPGEKGCKKCFRGLLCNSCNRGLGFFGDSVESLLAAASYLIRKES